MWQYQKTDELYHHGVLGMKWGVRRYQNKDGSLTSRGKKRRQMSVDAAEAAKIKKKKIYEMSNEELRKLNNRKNLEANYKRMNPGKIAAGAAAVGTAILWIDRTDATIRAANRIGKTGKKVAEKVLKGIKHLRIKK